MNNGKHICGRVALIGPANAGKSTLLNKYLGQKIAIVTPKPQTTRNQISGILSDENAQIIFLDTPGVHQLRGKMNRMLLQSAWQALNSADAIVILFDAEEHVKQTKSFEEDLALLHEVLAKETRPMAIALNKVDLFHDKSRMLPLITKLNELWPAAEIFPLSARTGEGLPGLLSFIKSNLPEGPAIFPKEQISTAPLRFMVSEIVREKLFLALKQEIPYYTAVEIEMWDEDPQKNLAVIGATIYVGRTNHKGMVIGKNGAMLKGIGIDARRDIEQLLEKRVHLDLWVKVKEGWSEDPYFLQLLSSSSEVLLSAEDAQPDVDSFSHQVFDAEDMPPELAEHLAFTEAHGHGQGHGHGEGQGQGQGQGLSATAQKRAPSHLQHREERSAKFRGNPKKKG